MGVIKIVSASYGRTDGKTCPHRAMSNRKCHSKSSLSKVAAACNGKAACSIAASNGVFGDPCGGTYKYLVASYSCSGALKPLPKPRPPKPIKAGKVMPPKPAPKPFIHPIKPKLPTKLHCSARTESACDADEFCHWGFDVCEPLCEHDLKGKCLKAHGCKWVDEDGFGMCEVEDPIPPQFPPKEQEQETKAAADETKQVTAFTSKCPNFQASNFCHKRHSLKVRTCNIFGAEKKVLLCQYHNGMAGVMDDTCTKLTHHILQSSCLD